MRTKVAPGADVGGVMAGLSARRFLWKAKCSFVRPP
jgi:hypothetical protein